MLIEPRAKIVHMTTVHRATDTRIFHRECRSLSEKGYEVVLIVPCRESGAEEGVRIRPVPLPANRLERMSRTVWKVFRAALEEGGDVYHFHDPELIPAALLLKLLGRRVVADVHEDVPGDIMSKFWVPVWVRRPLAFLVFLLQKLLALSVDAVITATPVIARAFPSEKTTAIRNYPILEEWPELETENYDERSPRVAYVGKIEETRGNREMVQAIGQLSGPKELSLALAGDFSPREFEDSLSSLTGWKRVEKLGFLDRPSVGRLLGRSRMGLILLHPGPNHMDAEPNKLYEYMAAGLPVIASNFPAWRKLVEGLDCGLVVDPLDALEIAEAIATLLEDPQRAEAMGRRGRQAVLDRFNWGVEREKLFNLYAELLD